MAITKKTTSKKSASLSVQQATAKIKEAAASDLKTTNPIKALNEAGISSPLIITGKEGLRVKRFFKWLLDSCFKDFDKSNLERLTFFSDEISKAKNTENFNQFLNNRSLFSNQKVAIIYDADKIKSTPAKALIEIIKTRVPDSLVILLGKSINRQTPLLNNLKSHATLIEITELSSNKLNHWLQKEARLQGAPQGIENSVAQNLMASYSDNLYLASSEIKKLALLSEDGLITEKTAKKIKFKTPERQSFEIIDSLSRKDLKLTLLRTKELLEQGQHPLQISSMLGRAFRIMLAISKNNGKTSGLTSDFANPWFAKNLSKSAARFKTSSLERNLKLLRKLDESLKFSKLKPETNLQNTLSKITL